MDSTNWQRLWTFVFQDKEPSCGDQPAQTGFFGAPVIDERFHSIYVWANITCPAPPPPPQQLFGPSFGRLYGLSFDGKVSWAVDTSNEGFDTGGFSLSSPVYVLRDGSHTSPCNSPYCVVVTIGGVSPKGAQKFAYAHSPNEFTWTRGPRAFSYGETAFGVHSPTAASDGTVYFSTADGLVAVDPNSLNTLWSVPDGRGGAAIGTDGTVYVGGFSAFYAIH